MHRLWDSPYDPGMDFGERGAAGPWAATADRAAEELKARRAEAEAVAREERKDRQREDRGGRRQEAPSIHCSTFGLGPPVIAEQDRVVPRVVRPR